MNERIAYLVKELAAELDKVKETPYDVGRRLYNTGHGISSIWGAVECDADMDECFRGYSDAKYDDQRKY